MFYEESEWKATYRVTHKKEPPDIPPGINSMNKMIATFGGFLNRKSDKEPGIKTMWIGIQRMRDFAFAFEFFYEGKTYG